MTDYDANAIAEAEHAEAQRQLEEYAALEGAQAVRGGESGEDLVGVRMPPFYTRESPSPRLVEGYEAKLDRFGTLRRILGHVTDEVDITASEENVSRFLVPIEALGPRNRPESIAFGSARDSNTPGIPPSYHEAVEAVRGHLAELEAAGLVEAREDGSYALTDAGRVELAN